MYLRERLEAGAGREELGRETVLAGNGWESAVEERRARVEKRVEAEIIVKVDC